MSYVVVSDYDPAWPAHFERLREDLWPAVRHCAERIEHVGSTSVPGLAAKPVIDMTIVTNDLPGVIAALDRIDYRHNGDQGVPGREAFRAPRDQGPDVPRHHTYACAPSALQLRNHLALRDALRADPDRARAYGELKRALARRFPDDIDAYVDGKTAFILALLKDAGFGSEELEAIGAVNRLP